MPLGRSAAHKICASALELAKALISKEALKGFQRGVGFDIWWQLITIITPEPIGLQDITIRVWR